MSDSHSGGSSGNKPSPWLILGLLGAAGLGSLLFLSMFGSGLREFGYSVAVFGVNFRIGKQELFFFFLMFILLASLGKMIASTKSDH